MTQLSRVLFTTTAATGAVLAGAGGASAEIVSDQAVAAAVPVVFDSLEAAVDPALDLKLYPLGNTAADILDNSVGTTVADFQPVGTHMVTGPISDGASARELPGALVGGLLGGLPVSLLPPGSTGSTG
ncbi:hypothetical protein [Streptomyces sp. SBT349]|uniref:hypothetical protein n=1 Tax=Streptomyces sp. SBT349 TaxID=1580539 RepID=UPI0007C7FF59|nr:hypothetical protein [Streptomyces sp. SBT349]